MKRASLALWLAVRIWPAELTPPPAINPGGIMNDASRMPASLPGGAIARGARFRIEGPRLGPQQAVHAAHYPSRELAGTTVSVTRGGRSWQIPLLMVSSTVIDGVLPKEIPVGSAMLSVTYRGQMSVPHPLRIAASGFGIYSQNGLGWGQGRWPPGITREHPAQPGQIVTLSGTGLGDTPNSQIKIIVGGRPAARMFRARRHCCDGHEEIRFALPPDSPEGCRVPVLVRAADSVSNTVEIELDRHGHPCQETTWALSPALSAERAGWLMLSHIEMSVLPIDGPRSDFRGDIARANFLRRTSPGVFAPLGQLPASGTCLTHFQVGSWRSLVSLLIPEAVGRNGTTLNSGIQATLKAAAGVRTLEQSSRRSGRLTAVLGGNLPVPGFERPVPLFLNPGQVEFQVAGTQDVGPFSLLIPITSPVLWINRANLSEVDRSKDLLLRWQAPLDSVVIGGAVNVDQMTGASTLCLCTAAESNRIVIPAYCLANLPKSRDTDNLPLHLVFVAALPRQSPAVARVSGLDDFSAGFVSISGTTVIFR